MIILLKKNLLKILLFIFLFTSKLLSQENNTFLLKPSGKYSIGTTELFLTDSSRKEMIKKSYKGYRRLYVKVWYPSDKNENLNYSKYFSNYDSKTIYTIFKSKNLSIEDFDSLKEFNTHSIPDIDISTAEKHFPVILFNSGFYFGMTDLYSNYMELLASNGYIVFSIIHPYQQPLVMFPDGNAELLKKRAQLAFLEWKIKERIKIEKINSPEKMGEYTKKVLKSLKRFENIVELWTIDNKFVLDYLGIINTDTSSIFYSKLDLDKIGVFGQSIGGATAGQLCFEDKRLKAGINIDNFQFGDIVDNDIETPFMLIESEYQKKWNMGNEYVFSHVKSDYYSLLLLNTTHFISSDTPLLPVLTAEQQELFCGNVNRENTIRIINNYILDFFNLYLKNISSDLLIKEVNNSYIIYKVRNKEQYVYP